MATQAAGIGNRAAAGVQRPARQSVTSRLMLLNGIATLSLVVHHAVNWGFTMMFAWAERYRQVSEASLLDPVGTAPYVILLIVKKLTSFSVPAFLFVSGYYYASYALQGKASIRSVAGSRVRKLALPYLFWSMVIFALEWIESCASGCKLAELGSYMGRLLLGEGGVGYYFVPLMIQLILIAPLLTRLAQRRWRLLLLAAGLLQAGWMIPVYLLNSDVHLSGAHRLFSSAVPFPLFILYFTVGIVFGVRRRELEPILLRFRSRLPLVVAILALAALLEPEIVYPVTVSGIAARWEFRTIAVTLYSTVVVLYFVANDRLLIPGRMAISRLGTKSYGVYLVHYLVMSYLARAIGALYPGLLAYELLLVPVIFVAGLVVPLVLMSIVSRSRLRPLYPYLFG